ncbi:alkaline phosphatase family protein [Dongia rigui]|uniref:Alkaline phosphatase family protein n=1 Tax=Dongia rigui TaxID=940149 RepID=A0ABU5E2U6_9PROT|nr:alkaline phosphatase family protein [Dongia rigui]MDY0873861.1 alkaline phosphatase family protein [Dongia rigui]
MTALRKILFISADQWRAECLSALGHPTVKTPHLDALAADSVLFKRHFTVTAPCGPARASLHTGLYLMNHRSGRNGTPLDARHTNVALEARKIGLDPTLLGYTDTSADPRGRHPNDPALKTYEGPLPGYKPTMIFQEYMAQWMADLKAKGYDFEGRHDVYKPKPGFEKPADRGHRFIPTFFKNEDSDTTFMANRILNWLDDRKQEEWFLHCVFLRPHPPVITPEPYNAIYDPTDVPFPNRKATPEEEAEQHPHLKAMIGKLSKPNSYDEHNPNNLVTMSDLELRQMRACYYGMMNEVDDAVGRIIAHLKATGEYDHTLIIFTCDHGEMGGDHYTWGKETYFDQSFAIPLMIRDPRHLADATRGSIVDAFTESVDIMPTILDWLGAEIPAQADGRSLMGFLTGAPPASWRQEAHMEIDFRSGPYGGIDAERAFGIDSHECQMAIIRGKRWKYVHFAALPPLLFDLENDPAEMNDLSKDPGHAGIMLEMAQKMLSWRLRHQEHVLTDLHNSPNGVEDWGKRRRG